MSACDDYRAMVPLFLDDELRGHDLQDLQKHIVECAECKDVLSQEQALSQLLHRSRPLYHAPEVLRARVSGILSSEAHLRRPHSGASAPAHPTNTGYSAQRSCSTDSPLEAVGSGGAGNPPGGPLSSADRSTCTRKCVC